MSIFKSISNIFSPAPDTSAPQAASTPTPPGNIPDPGAPVTHQSPNTEANGVVPAQSAQPAQAAPVEDKEPNSPLDKFNGLWEDKPNDPNAPTPPTAPAQLNPEDVQKAVAKANFTSAISDENLAAISEGGEPAKEAFVQAMNSVARQVMTHTTMVSQKLTDATVKKALEVQAAKLPEMLRNITTADHMRNTNPIFSNPAVKPVIDATHAKLAEKFPDATAQELTTMTQEFIVAMGESFAPKEVVNNNTHLETDWDEFMNAGQ